MPTDTDRTFSIHLYTYRGTDYSIEIEREKVRTYENGDTNRVEQKLIRRALSMIAARSIPGGLRSIATYADLANLISDCATDLAAQEAANPAIPAASNP